jgi:hypothetical protein
MGMTKKPYADFVRTLGVLRIHVQNLNRGLRTNDIDAMERESQYVQEILLDLIKNQRRMPKEQQQAIKPYFADLRRDALKCLELARKVLDDSLQATLELVRILEEANNYGTPNSGSSVVVDRKS